jgi:hypothetical protein
MWITIKYMDSRRYKCTLLLNNNKNISNAKEVSCNIHFVANNKSYYGVSIKINGLKRMN